MQRTCTKCGELKPLTEYRHNPRTGRYSFRCLCCWTDVPRNRHKSLETFLKDLYSNVKNNKRRRTAGFDETFTYEYLLELLEKQNRRCAVTGIELTHHADHDGTNVSIDRIDSNEPYAAGNVQLVCLAVNYMKHRMSNEQLGKWCVAIAKGMGLWK